MKVETKGLFEGLPNCMSLQDIIEYLDSRNYEERKKQEEYHEMYKDGSIILNNHIKVDCEHKDRVQIYYAEFQRTPLVTKDYFTHQPSWMIVPTTYANDVWVEGSVICFFNKQEKIINDPFVGEIKCKYSVKRIYSGSIHCAYTELTPQRLESMLTESIRNLKYIKDEVRYDDIIITDNTNFKLPIIMND